jgi:hypothetical protein
MRRDADLAVSDRIRLGWSSQDDEVRHAIVNFSAFISGEVLAVAIEESDAGQPFDIGGRIVNLEITKG